MFKVLIALAIGSASVLADGIRPGVITKDELREYAELSGVRKKLVDEALALAARKTWLKYKFGGADPEKGGLDCSGSVYFILREIGYEVPRTSAGQFTWVKGEDALHEIPKSVTSLDSNVFDDLTPGDLLFWSGTYVPRDGRKIPVSHVQIFLGHEKKDGKPVMIGASDGRSYRGQKRNGYGVFDFRLPRAGSKARFLGYGLPDMES